MSVAERKRRSARNPLIKMIIIAAAVIGVIVFAFIWEASLNREQEFNGYYNVYPPNALSEVQKKLTGLDWITPSFLPINEYSRPGTRLNEVNAVVIHYIGNPDTTAEQNRNYFANLSVSGEASLSSNFIVGLDGEILQCVPVDEVAYASNNRNNDTLSIECCHPDETGEFTDETYESAVKLTAWLLSEFELTSGDMIRHYDVSGKECPRYYVKNEDAWEAFKSDVADAMRAETAGDNQAV